MAGILRLERATGTIDGVNTTFFAPTPYEPGSLQVFRNGALQDKATSVVEVDPLTGEFELCFAPLGPNPNVPAAAGHPGDFIDVAYRDAFIATGGGAEGGVPSLKSAQELVPKVAAAPALEPKIAAAADVAGSLCPPKVGAADVAPKAATTVDIRPKIASAKEV